MSRPQFITQDQIDRWSTLIDNDPNLHQAIKDASIMREIIYASMYLGESLHQAGCHPLLITRIQYTMGSLSFGRDPWEVAQEMWQAYQNNDLEFETDYDAE